MQSRRVKDEAELACLVEGGKVMDRLYEVTAELLSPGIGERTVAAAIVEEMMRLKADPPAYLATLNPLIVATGADGSLPHAYTSERKVEKGDFVVCDYVLRYGGYVVDATRTFGIGWVSAEMKRSYEAVLRAQLIGIHAAKIGARTGDVDKAVRGHLTGEGLGDYFVHGTGHGVGIAVHEAPAISPRAEGILEEGMVITVEPGIYLPNQGGVRLEDMVLIGRTGGEIMTHLRKELLQI